jgi:hypothetical protein
LGSILHGACIFYAVKVEEMPKKNETRRRKQRGGTLAQGEHFASLHKTQHGGAATMLSGAPVGHQGLLESGLRDSARLTEYDAHFNQASGMSDTAVVAQKGGASRKVKKGKNGKKGKQGKQGKKGVSRKEKKTRRSKQRGGSRPELGHGPVGGSYMLLSASTKTGAADFSNPLLKH